LCRQPESVIGGQQAYPRYCRSRLFDQIERLGATHPRFWIVIGDMPLFLKFSKRLSNQTDIASGCTRKPAKHGFRPSMIQRSVYGRKKLPRLLPAHQLIGATVSQGMKHRVIASGHGTPQRCLSRPAWIQRCELERDVQKLVVHHD
jgi:hypothetical protein